MVTDSLKINIFCKFILVASIFWLFSMPSMASSGLSKMKLAINWVGLVDAREPDSLAVVGLSAAPEKNQKMTFFRLTGSQAKKIECCLNTQRHAVPTTVLRYVDSQNTMTEQGLRSRLTLKTEAGFVGLAFAPGTRAKIKRLNSRELMLQRSTRRGHLAPLYVKHCLSREGLHIWLLGARYSNQPISRSVHYYLHLGEDVQANCPASWFLSR